MEGKNFLTLILVNIRKLRVEHSFLRAPHESLCGALLSWST